MNSPTHALYAVIIDEATVISVWKDCKELASKPRLLSNWERSQLTEARDYLNEVLK